jgi:hypothetical protein
MTTIDLVWFKAGGGHRAAALALEERGHAPAALGVVQHHLRGPGQQGAHPQVATRIGVHPERREGVGVAGLQQVL